MSNNGQASVITLCKRTFRGPTKAERHAFRSLLEKAGHHVTTVEDGPIDAKSGGIVWIQGNANWFPVVCRQLAAMPNHERPRVVIWHSEPLPPPRAARLPMPSLSVREIAKILLRHPNATDVYTNYFRLRRLMRNGIPDLLVVSTPGRLEFLAERGINASWAPLGYDPFLGHDMGLRRDIDVLFIGEANIPRRKKLIKRLRRRHVNLLATGSWTDPACWGADRTRLLNRAKVFLNLQRYPGELSGRRLLLGMANKSLVISEPIYQPAPYVSGKHYVSASIEEMPEVISYYLAHDGERERITNEAHALATQQVTMERSVSNILQLIQDHSA